MDLMGMLGGVLEQVAGGQTPDNLHQHMDSAAGAIPQDALSGVLSHVFNSPETPDFSQMLGGLFGRSNAGTQANVLNGLLGSMGPAVLNQVLSGGGLQNLAGILGGGGAPRQLTPEEAAQIPQEEVQKLAEHAQQHNPGIVDEISQIYSAHPTLVKTLGTAAMMLAMRKIAEMQQQRG